MQLRDLCLNSRLEGREDAPPLVLSNSLGAALDMWAPQIPILTEHFRVLRYDTRGHGESGVPEGPYSIAQMGADVIGLLDNLAVGPVHFCGISMGGMIGMWLAVNAPDRLRSVVLCNTSAYMGPADNWNTRIARVNEGGMAAIVDMVIGRWFMAESVSENRPFVQSARTMLLNTPPDGYVASCAAIRDMDQRAEVGRIRVPTLVISGTRDGVTPPADGRFLAESIDGAHYVELDAAHLSNLERPGVFSRALTDFLGELGRSRFSAKP